MAKTRFPKEVGGVEMPVDVRRADDALIGRVHSRLGREALTAGLTLAAAAVIAARGDGRDGPDPDRKPKPKPDDAPEPPIAPEPPTPPVPPAPPVAPVPPTPPESRAAAKPAVTTVEAQAIADALGNVAEAALTRFLGGRHLR